jgi:hypothetical protein
MSKPLSNRLDKLEAEVLHSSPVGHNFHIIHTIINPDHSVHEVLETIIENGVVIRDDCGRRLG